MTKKMELYPKFETGAIPDGNDYAEFIGFVASEEEVLQLASQALVMAQTLADTETALAASIKTTGELATQHTNEVALALGVQLTNHEKKIASKTVLGHVKVDEVSIKLAPDGTISIANRAGSYNVSADIPAIPSFTSAEITLDVPTAVGDMVLINTSNASHTGLFMSPTVEVAGKIKVTVANLGANGSPAHTDMVRVLVFKR